MTPRGTQRTIWVLVAFVLAAMLTSVPSAFTQGRTRRVTFNGYEVVPGEVLVKLPQLAPGERRQLEQQLDADQSEDVGRGLDIRRIHSRSYNVGALIASLRTNPAVVYAEPNYVLHMAASPSDPFFPNLWGLRNTGQTVDGAAAGTTSADIRATSAWNVSTGSRSNVVAVIDTGIDYTHPDLVANVWTAPAAFTVTIGGVSMTCAAGTHGFNAITNSCDPRDDNAHGTHVSGTIGGVGNNVAGVAGVNWTASIMASKFLDATGTGTLANAVNAIEFTIQAKAIFGRSANVRVLNNSWAGGGYSQALLDEIKKAGANGLLFVAAAGNNAWSNDQSATYPADYTSYGATNIIAVAATDNNDRLAWFSNYGPTLVQLGAPGVNILSTTPNNGYQYLSGTSMAAPHVSGAAALLLSKCTLSTGALKSTLLKNVDVVAGLTGLVQTNGRLNVNKAIRACATPAAPRNLAGTAGTLKAKLTWTASTGATSYSVKRSTTSGGPYSTIATGVTTASYSDTAVTGWTRYYYVVVAVNSIGTSANSSQASATPFGIPKAPTNLTAASGLYAGQIALAWTASTGASSYNVKRNTISGGPYSTIKTGLTGTKYVDGSLSSGRRYYYVVSAVNAAGQSPNSGGVSAAAK